MFCLVALHSKIADWNEKLKTKITTLQLFWESRYSCELRTASHLLWWLVGWLVGQIVWQRQQCEINEWTVSAKMIVMMMNGLHCNEFLFRISYSLHSIQSSNEFNGLFFQFSFKTYFHAVLIIWIIYMLDFSHHCSTVGGISYLINLMWQKSELRLVWWMECNNPFAAEIV